MHAAPCPWSGLGTRFCGWICSEVDGVHSSRGNAAHIWQERSRHTSCLCPFRALCVMQIGYWLSGLASICQAHWRIDQGQAP